MSLVTNSIDYELPLNERTRILLRLEHLFLLCDHHLGAATYWDDRVVVNGLLDLLNIIGLTDLKSELIKELKLHLSVYQKLTNNPEVDSSRLTEFLSSLSEIVNALHHKKGHFASNLRSNLFIKGIAQRSTIPGGLCEFDVPFYHHWLQSSIDKRKADLRVWLAEFKQIRDAVEILLHLIRGSSQVTKEVAINGAFQHSLATDKPCRLVIITMKAGQPYYAEISGGKHRVNVRFVQPDTELRAVPINNDVTFEFSRCFVG